MDSLAETDHIALQEETNVDDRHDIDEQETADDASPSVDEVGDPQQLSYALLNLTEQNAWDDIMSQLVTWEAETAVALDLLQDEAAPLVRRLDPQEIFTLLRPVQALCEKIEDYPRLIQVHSDRTPGLLQRLCLGEPSVLSRLFVEDNFEVVEDDAFEIVKRLCSRPEPRGFAVD